MVFWPKVYPYFHFVSALYVLAKLTRGSRRCYRLSQVSATLLPLPFLFHAFPGFDEMTFTAGVMIFIEQFRARWPWSIGVLES